MGWGAAMMTAPGVSEIEIDFTGVEVRPIVIVVVLDGAGGDVGLSVYLEFPGLEEVPQGLAGIITVC
jgi:hypothetical protein